MREKEQPASAASPIIFLRQLTPLLVGCHARVSR
uniref:Uncharacterized protein n=1 Tax=Arundo donax TaxID=35708 RepID=A0A0A9BZI2_ARUDO